MSGLRVAAAVVVTLAACGPLPPTEDVCFEDDLAPLIAADCAICHENGEYGVRLRGEAADEAALRPYLEPGGPSENSLLDIVGGTADHPPIWPHERPERAMLEAWISEGASAECVE